MTIARYYNAIRVQLAVTHLQWNGQSLGSFRPQSLVFHDEHLVVDVS